MKNKNISGLATEQVSVDVDTVLLSADQLAAQMGVSTRTIWRLSSAGRMPQPLRLGRVVRWRSGDIEAWISAGCPEPGNDQQ